MTARQLIQQLLSGDWDLDMPVYVEDGSGEQCLLFGARVQRDRVVLGYDPNEVYER